MYANIIFAGGGSLTNGLTQMLPARCVPCDPKRCDHGCGCENASTDGGVSDTFCGPRVLQSATEIGETFEVVEALPDLIQCQVRDGNDAVYFVMVNNGDK